MSAVAELATVVGWDGASYATTDWDVVHRGLGFELPEEYLELHRVFPPGEFWSPSGDSVIVQPPYRVDGVPVLQRQFRVELDELRQWRDEHPEDVPDAVFPEPGGLVPWARGSRPVLLWDPSAWTVVVSSGGIWRFDDDHPVLERFALSAVEFLVGYLTGEVRSVLLDPEPGPGGQPRFRPLPSDEWERMSAVRGPTVRKISLR
ncbi:hypothetical protein [Actinokineospora diospyrosa]|uniref:SUKH superfamily protein n=1 Tax=Actinokineospora diospyrosa TaxID=103728 RepID=A0ABT1IF11_9PSEU|nr:hypothetical protein [Actinokineospora diospyrosa]MCP2271205.1 hypothetical protein [Actinokineospora diospyrosa]